MKAPRKYWYKLDNAAKIYPVIMNDRWMSIFRFTAHLTRDVDAMLLQRALDIALKRFPGNRVRLRRGIFWYYLEQYTKPILVEPDVNNPCTPFPRGKELFRLTYYRNRVSLEVFHAIADGGGAMAFFKTILAQYIRLLGVEVPATHGVLDIDEPPDDEEFEDSFLRYSRMSVLPSRAESRAYKFSGTPLEPGCIALTTGLLSVGAVKNKSREYGVTITEYLAAIYLYALYLVQRAQPTKRKYPVKVSVPVDLRRYYKTKTLRNFSQYVNPGIDPNYGEFTFEETLAQVHHFLRYMLTEKNLNARMSKNVSQEKTMVLRLVPLWIKNRAIMVGYLRTGENTFTTAMSNMGPVELPESMREYFTRFDMTLRTARKNAIECAIASYGDTLSVTFTRTIRQPHVERLFFQMLVRAGLKVKIESNMEG